MNITDMQTMMNMCKKLNICFKYTYGDRGITIDTDDFTREVSFYFDEEEKFVNAYSCSAEDEDEVEGLWPGLWDDSDIDDDEDEYDDDEFDDESEPVHGEDLEVREGGFVVRVKLISVKDSENDRTFIVVDEFADTTNQAITNAKVEFHEVADATSSIMLVEAFTKKGWEWAKDNTNGYNW
jgi:hypothetical protein